MTGVIESSNSIIASIFGGYKEIASLLSMSLSDLELLLECELLLLDDFFDPLLDADFSIRSAA